MPDPPYHLRTNKAVDRLLFIDTLHRFASVSDFSKYTYHSFGGPYLDDFRLMHEHFPKMRMVSIEKDNEVYKRQQFHQPSGYLKLVRNDLQSFLTVYESKKKKSIFWLDYTKLDLSEFNEFILLLGKVEQDSIVKITLRAHSRDYKNSPNDQKKVDGTYENDKSEKFKREFQIFLPSSAVTVPIQKPKFAKLLQDMVQIAAQQALPSAAGHLVFQPISSFFYEDGVGIFTLTGVVCKPENVEEIKSRFDDWPFANLDLADDPKKINVPFLSTKERFHMQKHLPCTGEKLSRYLRYEIGSDTSEQMNQYAEFYRQYPYFIRAVM